MGSHLDRDTAKQIGELVREFEQNPPTNREKFAAAIGIAMNNGISAQVISVTCGVPLSTVDGWRFMKDVPWYWKRCSVIRTIVDLLKRRQKLLEKPTW